MDKVQIKEMGKRFEKKFPYIKNDVGEEMWKELINELTLALELERLKWNEEMRRMIDKIFKDNTANGMYSPDGVAESLAQLSLQLKEEQK
jgi:hypothetical protein